MSDIITDMLIAGNDDLAWFEQNRARILQQYDNKFVALHNKQIIDADSNAETLIERLRAKHIDLSRTLVRFVTKVARIL